MKSSSVICTWYWLRSSQAHARSALWGSWLACDTGTSVFQLTRGDAIAGKPAPTPDGEWDENLACRSNQLVVPAAQRLPGDLQGPIACP
ncbi:hypothetical protein F7R12_11040 [Pseudomonas tolaasii]|nr:hypothetical protein F7R12_11040 [Pseudomonas tolaasii]